MGQRKIAMGKKIFTDQNRLFPGKLNLELKKSIINCLVQSAALYAAEIRTLAEADRSRLRLEAFAKMWIWRRIGKVS